MSDESAQLLRDIKALLEKQAEMQAAALRLQNEALEGQREARAAQAHAIELSAGAVRRQKGALVVAAVLVVFVLLLGLASVGLSLLR
jgi:hypothetical protein